MHKPAFFNHLEHNIRVLPLNAGSGFTVCQFAQAWRVEQKPWHFETSQQKCPKGTRQTVSFGMPPNQPAHGALVLRRLHKTRNADTAQGVTWHKGQVLH